MIVKREAAGMRLLEDQHARARRPKEERRAAIAAGLASGHGKAADAVFHRLETKYRKQAGRHAT